jgi:D-galactarolactone isomerase
MTILRRFTGTPPEIRLPKGTIDTQMHAYLPDFAAQAGGPPLPNGELPSPAQYRQLMQWLGIERVVITQGNAHQSDNSNLIACLAELGEIARGIAAIHSDITQNELKVLADNNIVGARIMNLPGGATGFDQLESVDTIVRDMSWMMTVQFNGSDIAEHFPRLNVLKSRWVLDHHAKFLSGHDHTHIDNIKRLIDRGNVWFKFAGCYESSIAGAPDYSDIAEVARDIAAYAPERIIWGSNWPHNMCKTTEDYPNDAALTDTVLSWLPTDMARKLALVDNPEELFGFSKIEQD